MRGISALLALKIRDGFESLMGGTFGPRCHGELHGEDGPLPAVQVDLGRVLEEKLVTMPGGRLIWRFMVEDRRGRPAGYARPVVLTARCLSKEGWPPSGRSQEATALKWDGGATRSDERNSMAATRRDALNILDRANYPSGAGSAAFRGPGMPYSFLILVL
jgi:hypothetical protein